MKSRINDLSIAIFTGFCFAASVHAADDEAVRKDLFTVITLQGLPCGEVVTVTTKSENDHIAACKDGNRYHVYVNAQGRVVVEKQ